MALYRIYFLASERIGGRQDFEADEDVAAIRIAHVLHDMCSDICQSFELWQGNRQIRAQQPQPRDSTVSLTDLIEDHQRVAIDTEEVISRSDWTNPNSTACRSAFHRASLGKVKNSGAAYRAQRSLMFAPWNATARLIAWASTSTSLCSRHVRPSRLSSDVS